MARTVPVSTTHVPGDLDTAAQWNAGPVASNAFLTLAPTFVGYMQLTQSIPTSTPLTGMAFDSTALDSDNGHSNVSANSRYVTQVAGWYVLSGSIAYAATPSSGATDGNERQVIAYVNGVAGRTLNVYLNSTTDTCGVVIRPTLLRLGVGDYVEVFPTQYSGIAVSTVAATPLGCSMTLCWVAQF